MRYLSNKSILRLFSSMLMLSVALGMSAQTWTKHHSAFEDGDNYHFGYISGSVGYSMLETSFPNSTPHGDTGGSVGLGYEFRNSGLWTSVGVQMTFHRSSLTVEEYLDNHKGLDTQG